MEAQQKHPDRRVQRTRQALQQAFRDVVLEKGFAAATIQDIADRANVNRGTFYLHFADKYMLLDTFVREDFQRLIKHTALSSRTWNRASLRLLIQTLLQHFEQKYRHQRHIPPGVAPLVEQALAAELTALLLTWLRPGYDEQRQQQVPVEALARIVSWAIFGSILQWSQEETTISAEQMTGALLLVVLNGLESPAPSPLPD